MSAEISQAPSRGRARSGELRHRRQWPQLGQPSPRGWGARIGPGEVVVCDFGGSLALDDGVGYCSDITRTVVTGEPEPEFAELYEILRRAQALAVSAAVVGATCEEVDRAGRDLIAAAGYGKFFIHRIGHGIGIEEHEDPYMVAGNATPLVSGHAFSIEPGHLPRRSIRRPHRRHRRRNRPRPALVQPSRSRSGRGRGLRDIRLQVASAPPSRLARRGLRKRG